MKTLSLTELDNLKWENASRIVLKGTNQDPVQSGLKLRERGDIKISYKEDINKTTTTFFSKYDIRNLKAFSNFYGYWFNLEKKTLSINGELHDILKVKENLYLRNRNTKNITNLRRHFKVARMLNTIKVFEKIFKENERKLESIKKN